MRKKFMALCCVLVGLAGALTGCSAKGSAVEVTTTTICIDEDGTVTHKIVEPFDKEYYDADALSSMIQEEIDEYNKEKGAQAVTLVSTEEVTDEESGERKAFVTMTYASAEDYQDFNGKLLFYGTVTEATEAGYDVNVSLKSAKDNTELIGKEEIEAMGNSHIVIYEENVQISLAKKILYTNPECEIINKYMATGNSTAVHTYIITK